MKVNLKQLEERFGALIKKPIKNKDEIDELLSLREILEKEYLEDIRPLIEDLNKIGYEIDSVWNFVNSNESYESAIPTLLEHLSKPYHHKNKEGIIRALTVKEAKGIAGKKLIEEYFKTPSENYNLRWVIGSAISVVIAKKDVEDVLRIIKDRQNGESREMFIEALGKIRAKESKPILLELLENNELLPYTIKALSLLKCKEAIPKLKKLSRDSNKEVSKAAIKALKRIEK